jgi:hypothetical protein
MVTQTAVFIIRASLGQGTMVPYGRPLQKTKPKSLKRLAPVFQIAVDAATYRIA